MCDIWLLRRETDKLKSLGLEENEIMYFLRVTTRVRLGAEMVRAGYHGRGGNRYLYLFYWNLKLWLEVFSFLTLMENRMYVSVCVLTYPFSKNLMKSNWMRYPVPKIHNSRIAYNYRFV